MISQRKLETNRANVKHATAAIAARAVARRAAYDLTPKRCACCGKPIPYDKRVNRFCGHSCSATISSTGRPRSAASRRKTGDAILGRLNKTREQRRCRLCGEAFEAIVGSDRQYCKPRCGRLASATAARKLMAELALRHIPCEVAPLAALNALFRTSFRKERVAGRYFDFADDKYLIEHTRDWGKGVGSATKRFALAKDDKRKKILYADSSELGHKRFARLAALGVSVRDYRELELTKWK